MKHKTMVAIWSENRWSFCSKWWRVYKSVEKYHSNEAPYKGAIRRRCFFMVVKYVVYALETKTRWRKIQKCSRIIYTILKFLVDISFFFFLFLKKYNSGLELIEIFVKNPKSKNPETYF